MFNSSYFKLKIIFSLVIITNFFFSCKNEATLNFTEISIVDEDETIIEINIPKAKENTDAAKQINKTLTQFVNSALDIEAVSTTKTNTKENIEAFKNAYKNFKIEIGKTLYTNLPPWEVLIDGEVIYKSKTLVSIAMSSSINTGGAHSNLVFKFYNFNVLTGQQLEIKDLINDIPKFKEFVKKYYTKELLTTSKNGVINNETIPLPNQLGFNNEGVICVFFDENIPNNEMIEFTIPYTVINNYLNF